MAYSCIVGNGTVGLIQSFLCRESVIGRFGNLLTKIGSAKIGRFGRAG